MLRKSRFSDALGGRLTELLRHHHEEKYGLEIKFNNIGAGLLLFHPFNITISTNAILGENVSIYKGVTIGSVRSGKRKGYPKIGNKVVICSNANVLGGITIGDDVLIAGGAFVDFDVPDHSVVIGNPGIIHYKEDCTKDYLCGK